MKTFEFLFGLSLAIETLAATDHLKSVNLKYITVGRLDDDMIVPPSDGAMFILID